MRRAGDNEWAENSVSRLRELWSEGHSTAEIGRRLGVSKNAVVGKANRLGLPARPSPIKRGGPGGPRRRTRAKPKLAGDMRLPPGAPAPRAPAAITRRETTAVPRAQRRDAAVSRTATCCWPIGPPGEPGFRFCNAPALVAKPYCGDHANQAYEPLRRRDDDRQGWSGGPPLSHP